MTMPRLTIDLGKITRNTRLVAELLGPHGVGLTGVTKACPGDTRVAAAMLAGGATALADSRLENIVHLRRELPDARLTLMRPPAGGEAVATDADLWFISSQKQLDLLPALSPLRPLSVCLMVETGDGREGIPTEKAPAAAETLATTGGVKLAGLATTAACARPEADTAAALALLLELAGDTTRLHDGFLSAGGSGLLRLLVGPEADTAAALNRLSELRCGEAILLGRIPAPAELFLPGGHRDAFVVEAPVLEVFHKEGERRALVGIGRQETGGATLYPARDRVETLAVTSDYLAVAVKGDEPVSVGEDLAFIPSYYALLALMTTPSISRDYGDGGSLASPSL